MEGIGNVRTGRGKCFAGTEAVGAGVGSGGSAARRAWVEGAKALRKKVVRDGGMSGTGSGDRRSDREGLALGEFMSHFLSFFGLLSKILRPGVAGIAKSLSSASRDDLEKAGGFVRESFRHAVVELMTGLVEG